jgi:hypothetical protein
MGGLIKALVNVRDALSLIAFLSLVFLVAFRTKKVPELLFGLVRDKLTRQQFYGILHRFMLFGFIAFLALVALAVVAQVLNRSTQPNSLSIDDLRRELAHSAESEESRIHAEALYRMATEKASVRDFQGAIAALRESIAAIPTLTAEETMIYLYRAAGDLAGESTAWEAAMKTARKRGDTLALVRLEMSSVPSALPSPFGEHDLIGRSEPLPKGGTKFEEATVLNPGFYSCAGPDPCVNWWYKDYLKSGQTMRIRCRTSASGGLAGAAILGTNGENLQASTGDPPGTMHGNARAANSLSEVEYTARAQGWHFLRIDSDPNAVYRLLIR